MQQENSQGFTLKTLTALSSLGCLAILCLVVLLFAVPFLVAGGETNNASATCGAPAIESKEGSKTVNVPRAIPKTRQRRLQRSRSPRANHRSPTPSNSPR